jgi:ribonuclease J
VIFSSRTIPGNEKAVNRVVNGLVGQGIEVITDRTHLVHVSGHPRRGEMEDLYGWVRPRIAIPVHGEVLHLAEHAALARRLGVPAVIECQNGDLVRLAPGAPAIVDEVPQGRLYKDGRLLISADTRTVADRRRLGFVGIVSVALAIDEKGALVADPQVEMIGIPETDGEGQSFVTIAFDAAVSTVEHLPKARRRDALSVQEAVTRAVRAAVAAAWGKKPQCRTHVLVV